MGEIQNFGRLLAHSAARDPQGTALVWGERRWSWRELDDRVDALCAGLRAAGVGRGDRVVVQSRNSNRLLESAWAVWKAGAVWVPVNYRLTPPEVAGLAGTARPAALLYEAPFAAHAAAAAATLEGARLIVAMDAPRPGEIGYEALVAEHLCPVCEFEIGCYNPCNSFIQFRAEGEQQLGAGSRERDEAEFVQEHQVELER